MINQTAYYTLLMIDPDADMQNNGSWPEGGTGAKAPVRHWAVGNLEGV